MRTEKKEVKAKKIKENKLIKPKKADIKKKKTLKKEKTVISFSLLEVIIIILMTGITVSVCSGVIVYKNYSKIAKEYDTSPTGALAEFETTYKHILSSYVEDIDEEKLIDAAIEGMFDYLEDSHTTYLDETETTSLQEKLKGEYIGVGVEITNDEDGNVIILRVFDNSPAKTAGLMDNDIIIDINGESMIGRAPSYVSGLIKEKNQTFDITVKRENEEKKFTVSTGNVLIPSIESKIYDKTGYIKIEVFSATTSSQFETALKDLENKNIKNLIIDVRNNTGGYLSSAYEIADLFIKKGKIIYELKDKDGNIEAFNAKKEVSRKYKINVLINESSASASEILAGALKYSYGASLIGKKTFGKGTVQETENLNTGSMIKYTTAYWLMPNGECIDGIGIKPDVEVDDDTTTEIDEQYDVALNEINK